MKENTGTSVSIVVSYSNKSGFVDSDEDELEYWYNLIYVLDPFQNEQQINAALAQMGYQV